VRGFVALLGWEWRSHRVIAYAMAALMLVLSLTFRGLASSRSYWDNVATFSVPTMWVLFVGGLTADVVTGDLATRRIETLALVPASLMKLWTSKATFVVLALAVSLGWTILCQALTAVVFDPANADQRFAQLLQLTFALPYALPLLMLTMLFATLTERTLPAMFLGFVVAVGFVAGLTFILRFLAPEIANSEAGRAVTWQVAGFSFAATAATAFVRGRVHTSDRGRRWIVASAFAGSCLLAVAAFAAWKFAGWKQLAPGDADAEITQLSASPDGKWLAIAAMKHGNGQMGVTTTRVWTMPIDGDGPIVESKRDQQFDWNGAWDDDGSLRLVSVCDHRLTTEFTDPSTGAVRRATECAALAFDPRAAGSRFPWWLRPDESLNYTSASEAAHTSVLDWPERGVRRTATTLGLPTVSRRPGVVWYRSTLTRLMRLDVASGAESVLHESKLEYKHAIRRVSASADGLRLIVGGEDGHVVLAADTGAVIAGPWPTGVASWPSGAADGRFVVLDDFSRQSLVDLTTGRTVLVGDDVHGRVPNVEELADGRFVTLTADSRVDLHAANGDVVRHLYPPQRSER
jgi:ABC-type transport system involved in multi-copper enzyme maturation permease subunit